MDTFMSSLPLHMEDIDTHNGIHNIIDEGNEPDIREVLEKYMGRAMEEISTLPQKKITAIQQFKDTVLPTMTTVRYNILYQLF